MIKLKLGDYFDISNATTGQLREIMDWFTEAGSVVPFIDAAGDYTQQYLGWHRTNNCVWFTDDEDDFKCNPVWRKLDLPDVDTHTINPSDVLRAGAQHMEDRAAVYDKDGERSIPATVTAFNAITGHKLSDEQGWLFMTLLKAVRSQQGDFKLDNYEDGAAYFALMAEAADYERS